MTPSPPELAAVVGTVALIVASAAASSYMVGMLHGSQMVRAARSRRVEQLEDECDLLRHELVGLRDDGPYGPFETSAHTEEE